MHNDTHTLLPEAIQRRLREAAQTGNDKAVTKAIHFAMDNFPQAYQERALNDLRKYRRHVAMLGGKPS